MIGVHVVQIPALAEVHVLAHRDIAEHVRDAYMAAGVEAILSQEPVLDTAGATEIANRIADKIASGAMGGATD